jgi:hypothetical protein
MMRHPGMFLSREIPAAAAWLGGLGVVPFVAAAIAAVAGPEPWRELALRAFVAYSAVILSFLGGIRWGAALGDADGRRLALSVAPSLLAFGCLLLTPSDAVKLLAVLFAAVGFFDAMRRPMPDWPAWFMRLRARLSGAVVVVHLALWAALP